MMHDREQVRDVIELSSERREEGDTETHIFELRIPPDLAYFEGHFDGEPILAAVVQLDVLVLPRVERLWPDLGHVERATKMKFRVPIRENDQITLTLSRRAQDKRVRVALIKDGIECASGTLFFT